MFNERKRQKEEEYQWGISLKREDKKFLDSFLSDIRNAEWAKKRRLKYLRKRKKEVLLNMADWVGRVLDSGLGNFLDMKEEQKELKKIKKEVELYENPRYQEKHLDETMIETARNYPIENLIDMDDQGFAICPFHNDTSPSAYCKNNYLYCFSCGVHADTIKLYKHLYGCSFKQAVNSLQNCG